MIRTVRIPGLCFLVTFISLGFSSSKLQPLAIQTSVEQTVSPNEQNDERSTAKSEEFIHRRPSGNKVPATGYYYRVASKTANQRQTSPSEGQRRANSSKHYQTNFTIGVTIGRARRATEAELNDLTIAKVHSTSGIDFVLERITGDPTVTHGTLLQLMIEYLGGSARSKLRDNRVGYLYVINRVQYANGTYSEPRLIFPTRRTYGGDNRVLPGKVVILPDPQRLWEIGRNSLHEQAFETYLIIVSDEPLKDSRGVELQLENLSDKAITLNDKLVAGWVRTLGGGTLRAELESTTKKYLTQREQAASGNTLANQRDTREQANDLTQADLPPQTVFRKLVGNNGKMLVTIKLPFKDSGISARSQP